MSVVAAFEIEKADALPILGDQSILFDPENPINRGTAQKIFDEKFIHLIGEPEKGHYAYLYVSAGLHPLFWPEGEEKNIISIILLCAAQVTTVEEGQIYEDVVLCAMDYLDLHIIDGNFSLDKVEDSLAIGPPWAPELADPEGAKETVEDIRAIFNEKKELMPGVKSMLERWGF